jgi:hypothetical protein
VTFKLPVCRGAAATQAATHATAVECWSPCDQHWQPASEHSGTVSTSTVTSLSSPRPDSSSHGVREDLRGSAESAPGSRSCRVARHRLRVGLGVQVDSVRVLGSRTRSPKELAGRPDLTRSESACQRHGPTRTRAGGVRLRVAGRVPVCAAWALRRARCLLVVGLHWHLSLLGVLASTQPPPRRAPGRHFNFKFKFKLHLQRRRPGRRRARPQAVLILKLPTHPRMPGPVILLQVRALSAGSLMERPSRILV